VVLFVISLQNTYKHRHIVHSMSLLCCLSQKKQSEKKPAITVSNFQLEWHSCSRAYLSQKLLLKQAPGKTRIVSIGPLTTIITLTLT